MVDDLENGVRAVLHRLSRDYEKDKRRAMAAHLADLSQRRLHDIDKLSPLELADRGKLFAAAVVAVRSVRLDYFGCTEAERGMAAAILQGELDRITSTLCVADPGFEQQLRERTPEAFARIENQVQEAADRRRAAVQ